MAGLLNAKNEEQQEPIDNTQEEGQEPKESNESVGQEAEDDPQDPILKQLEDGIEQSVPQELRKQYLAIVTSGMKVMFSKGTSQFMTQRLGQAGDPVQAVSSGIADLLLLIYNESKRTMSIPAGMLASFTLMAQALDFAEKAGKVKVSPDLVAQCADATWQAVTQKFGISKDQIEQAIAQSQGGQGGQDQAQAQPQGGLLQRGA